MIQIPYISLSCTHLQAQLGVDFQLVQQGRYEGLQQRLQVLVAVYLTLLWLPRNTAGSCPQAAPAVRI